MAHTGTQKRKTPRKSAVAKAALRKSAAGGNEAQRHKLASQADLAEALANRPKVDFLDPFMRHAAMQAKGIGLCAFLVTLAAFQRGLKVTFHYERASFDPRFAKAKMQGHRGELFSISNGTRTHTFSRTMGDLTDPVANAVAEDKHLSKIALKRAGVRSPQGVVVDASQTSLAKKFLSDHPDMRFVIKPFDGSLSKEVYADLSVEDVFARLEEASSGRIMLEEFITGREYRATVVDGRCVAVSWRQRPSVTGDGKSTIQELWKEKSTRLAAENPFWQGLSDDRELKSFLVRSSLALNSVPGVGRTVHLTNIDLASIHTDVTTTVSADVKRQAEQAALTLGLVNCGVDLIAPELGEPVVLELNQRSHIGMHSFPVTGESTGQGNAVAEAIIDYYFPQSIHNKTYSSLAYDFVLIRTALEASQISELSLPVIGPDWKVLRFTETGIAAMAMAKLIETAARTAGVFTMSAPHDKGGVALCLAYAPANFRNMLSVIPAQFRRRLEQLDAEVKG